MTAPLFMVGTQSAFRCRALKKIGLFLEELSSAIIHFLVVGVLGCIPLGAFLGNHRTSPYPGAMSLLFPFLREFQKNTVLYPAATLLWMHQGRKGHFSCGGGN